MRIVISIVFILIVSIGISQNKGVSILAELIEVLETQSEEEIYNYANEHFYFQLTNISHSEKVSLEKLIKAFADSTSLDSKILLSCLYEIRTNIYNQSNLPERDKYNLINGLLEDYESIAMHSEADSSRIKSLYYFKGKSSVKLGYFKQALRSYENYLSFSDVNTIRNLEPSIPIKLKLRQLDNLEIDIQNLIQEFTLYDQVLYIGKCQFYLLEYYLLTEQFEKARSTLTRIDKRYSKQYPGNYYKKLANAYRKLEDKIEEEKALKYQLEAVKQDTISYPNSLNQDLDLAEFYLRNNNLELAHKFFNTVVEKNVINHLGGQNFIDINSYTSALIGLSEVYLLDQNADGLDILDKAYELIKNKFNTLQFQEDKLVLTESYKKIISLKIKYRNLLNISNEKLYQLSEESKAIALLDELQINKKIESRLSSIDYLKLKKVKENIFKTEKKIKEISNIESQYSNLRELINLREGLINDQNIILNSYDIKDLITSSNKSKQKLKDHQQILNYFIYDTSAVLISKNRSSLDVYELDFSLSNQKKLIAFNNLILAGKNLEQVEKLSSEIKNIILPKALNLKEELIIIPDGILSFIPFECLRDDNNKYLVEEKIVSYNYSMEVLGVMRDKHVSNKEVLACAPIYYSNITDYPLESLTENVNEISYLASTFRNTIQLEKNNANKQNFLNNISSTKLLHFAGHADINALDIDKSYLAFSDQSGVIGSTLLFLDELYNLDLSTELIVLSACNTGMGNLLEGEGILSLARGFIYAGTKAVVSSLWKADDQSTKDIMIDFYQFLSKGYSKDRALSYAKRKYINENGGSKKHPYYWAGFVLIGDSSPIFATSTWWIYTLVALGVLLLILFFVTKKKASV